MPLDDVTGTISIRLSASPDCGWPTLAPFLAGRQVSLAVGLYDFTSVHILAAFESPLARKKVDLVLDHPARNPTADQSDEQTVKALHGAFGAQFTQGWALERMDPFATAWIFPSASHIKVAVRDSTSMLLSSGNLNNSNQLNIEPMPITPLLTPDVGIYLKAVVALIASARTSLYLQFQYIELPPNPGATSQALMELVSAVIEPPNTGVGVRIIMSQCETAGHLKQLLAAGLDVVTRVRLQNNVHNKGLVADGDAVLVSSQN